MLRSIIPGEGDGIGVGVESFVIWNAAKNPSELTDWSDLNSNLSSLSREMISPGLLWPQSFLDTDPSFSLICK